ncbi:MAG: DUF2807 domain-containing protein [Bacteroidetes bacterium]|nr:DUF2807 domain-containing protein [Bacteroidota bacterium]
MNNAFRHLAVLVCSTAVLFSCRENTISGHGNIGNEMRNTGSFTAIEISVPLKASIRVGAAQSVKLSGYSNILKYIKTEVKDNKLKIFTDPGVNIDNAEYLNAEISIPSLSQLVMEGAPDAEVHGPITGQDFQLTISGASDVTIDEVNTTHFSTTVSGAGDVKVSKGTVQQAEYSVAGAGDIKAYGLHSTETSATVAGAGDVDVYAEQKLTTSISGAGTVRYKGHPQVTTQTSGMGGVEDAN